MNKKVIIVGASSGIGLEIACLLATEDYDIAITGRDENKLKTAINIINQNISDGQKSMYSVFDICEDNATNHLDSLINKLGGMDLYIHSAGVGWQNAELDVVKENTTSNINVFGFTHMIVHVFRHMISKDCGHIVVISSIAGTKGLGPAPSYSASKAYQSTYIEALQQLASIKNKKITLTDIRPGFVATDLINNGIGYPMVLSKELVAKKIIKAIKKHKNVAVIDCRWRLVTFFWKIIPHWLWRKIPLQTKRK